MDTATLAATVIPAVISVLIALAIGAVGYVIAALNESKRWQRQQRVVIYTKIAKHHKMIDRNLGELSSAVKGSLKTSSKSENVIEPPLVAQLSKPQQEQRDEIALEFNELNKELTGIQAELDIIGSRKAIRTFNQYIKAGQASFIAKLQDKSAESKKKIHNQAWATFIDQAQRDLGLRHWWNKRR